MTVAMARLRIVTAIVLVAVLATYVVLNWAAIGPPIAGALRALW